MIRTTLAACFTMVLASQAGSQTPITLSNSNMPGSNDTLRYTNVSITTLGSYSVTGVNHSWDFSKVTSLTEGVRSFKPALQTPYFLFFLSANEYGEKIADTLGAGPLTITKYYNYYKKQTSPQSAFIADGVGLTFSSVPVPSYYTDKDELYIFPMTYGKYDSTTFKFSTPSSSTLPFVYTKAGYRVTRVDGWGTVTTPYGTENCLRIVTTQYAIDSVKNKIIPFPLGFPNYQRSYQWLTLNSKIPYMEISGGLVGNIFTPNTARYRGYDRKLFISVDEMMPEQFQLYPNPVAEVLYIKQAGASEFSIFSAEGRLVLKGSVKEIEGEGSIIVSGLENGLYFIELSSTTGINRIKFIKQ
jgi:hypothetical protein